MISKWNSGHKGEATSVLYISLVTALLSMTAERVQTQPFAEGAPSGSSAKAEKIVITPGGPEEPLQVAVAEFDVSSGRDNELEVIYAKTAAYDLDFSDLFVPMTPTPQMAAQHRADSQIRAIDYEAWMKLGAQVLLKAEFEDLGSRGRIRFFAHDVYGREPLDAVQYDLSYESREKKIREVRRAVHNFVDKMVAKYQPLPGCASSYIAFENLQQRADAAGNPRTVREIFIMDYDGRNVRQITQDRNLAVSPAWSPDGRKLVYTSYRQGPPDLYLYDLDSGRIRVLAAFPGLNSAAAWSPDGRFIAASLSRDGNPEIYRLGSDGSNPVRLTQSRSVETSPTWSADGSTIYFISDRFGAPQIMGMPASGGQAWSLTRRGHNDDPNVSPLGDKIVFTSNQSGGGFNIFIMNADGGDPVNLTGDLRGNCEHPTWAPDGRHIAFSYNGQIVAMDADGSDKRILTNQERIPGSSYSPAWGP